MAEPIILFINTNCCQGKGLNKWRRIRTEVLERLPEAQERYTHDLDDLKKQVSEALQQEGNLCLLSAGGDGSIHQLCNLVLASGHAHRVSLGAIGLGSSNDFLKPFQHFVQGCPTRINLHEPTVQQDVGMVRYTDVQGRNLEKYFLINASFGVTAEGNGRFNEPGRLLQRLKKTNTSLAINYAAVSTILGFKSQKATFQFGTQTFTEAVSNINILKTPYVSGSLKYDQDLQADDGRLGLNICMNLTKLQLLKTLMELGNGKFRTDANKISTFVTHFELHSDEPVVFECDGETEKVRDVTISILPKVLNLLNP